MVENLHVKDRQRILTIHDAMTALAHEG